MPIIRDNVVPRKKLHCYGSEKKKLIECHHVKNYNATLNAFISKSLPHLFQSEDKNGKENVVRRREIGRCYF